ncbi:MAG: dihydropteroate synthase [Gammaproteobacteria bacterium]
MMRTLDLSQPQVMGILNFTPNSQTAVGRFQSVEPALRHAARMMEEGAAIIDVGGEPTNPGVFPIISLQEEMDRVLPLLERLRQELPVLLSVDTSKPEVMQEAIRLGVDMINDVRALRLPGALAAVSQSQVAVCLMHMRYPEGRPAVPSTSVDSIETEVFHFLQDRVQACLAAGIEASRIVIDPGIGHGNFGKDLAENIRLIRQLSTFKALNLPILVGVSRKTFIGEILNLPVEDRLYGSLAATVVAIQQGASIVRTHDVKATMEILKVIHELSDCE